jgi:hypothetical protein
MMEAQHVVKNQKALLHNDEGQKIISITMMYLNLQQTLVVFPIFTYKSQTFLSPSNLTILS